MPWELALSDSSQFLTLQFLLSVDYEFEMFGCLYWILNYYFAGYLSQKAMILGLSVKSTAWRLDISVYLKSGLFTLWAK